MDAALRALVRERADGRCEYCRLRQEFLPLTLQLEHIIAIVGRTPTGRATVRVLNMNAPRRVRLRAALLEREEWSP
jgi:hypothetical protein